VGESVQPHLQGQLSLAAQDGAASVLAAGQDEAVLPGLLL